MSSSVKLESKGKAPIIDDVPVQENQDVEMEDHPVNQENQELALILTWDMFKSHCKKKTRQDGNFNVLHDYCEKSHKLSSASLKETPTQFLSKLQFTFMFLLL